MARKSISGEDIAVRMFFIIAFGCGITARVTRGKPIITLTKSTVEYVSGANYWNPLTKQDPLQINKLVYKADADGNYSQKLLKEIRLTKDWVRYFLQNCQRVRDDSRPEWYEYCDWDELVKHIWITKEDLRSMLCDN